jgi:lysophospholipase L1-like esterase
VKDNLRAGFPVKLAVIGDSTSCGFGANGDANWDVNSPYAIPFSGYVSQAVQDNIAIPSAVRLTRTWIEQLNPASKVYNFGASGWRADEHVNAGTVSSVLALQPDAVIIALGINSAKNGQSQSSALSTLISQLQSGGVEVFISLGHNLANLNTTTPMPFWITMRNEMKTVAANYNCQVIDPGSDDGAIIPSLTHDGFHPSALGYVEIYKKYKEVLGGFIKIGKQSFNKGNGALRISGQAYNLTLNAGATKINTSNGVFTISA